MQYSVLMSVYWRDRAEYLRAAMDSMWGQTAKTDDFVLICDGPLTDGLNSVIREMEDRHTGVLHVIRLEKNGGLGKAMNAGIKECRNEIIARMDADDISRPERCEKQIQIFSRDKEISICSGTVEEFTENTDRIYARRRVPETDDEIRAFAKKRNPFNHPCVMYRKSSVESAGGYEDFYLLEDYHLWIRMLQQGLKGYNIQEPLLWMRVGAEMYRRRAGWKYARSQKALFMYMKDTGFISRGQYMKSFIIRGISAMTPNRGREYLYKKVIRER